MQSFNRHWRMFALVLSLLSALAPSVAAQGAGDAIVYYDTDAIGSVRFVSNAAGQMVERHDYLPFGQEWTSDAGASKRKFAGKEHDGETSFDYFGARYYASSTGRFTSVDPDTPIEAALRDPQILNRYAYVRNNPLRHTDPDGRCIWDLCVSEIALAVGLSEGAVLASEASVATAFVWHNREAIGRSVAGAFTAAVNGINVLLASPKEGVYRFPDRTAPGRDYNGQSVDLPRRLGEHAKTGKRNPGDEAMTEEVLGGKTQRELAEQRLIDEQGGTREKAGSKTSNQRNPISPERMKKILEELKKSDKKEPQ